MFMRKLSLFAIVLGAGAALACAPTPTSKSDASGSGGSGGGGGGTGGVTYTKDVQPILMAKCAPCHTTQGLGAHNIAATYDDVHDLVVSLDAPPGCFLDGFDRTMPKTMGECALAAIMEGWMPMGGACFNTPRPDVCVTLAQQDVIAAWVAAGMPK